MSRLDALADAEAWVIGIGIRIRGALEDRRQPRAGVLWGGRPQDLQFGSPADLELAELRRRRAARERAQRKTLERLGQALRIGVDFGEAMRRVGAAIEAYNRTDTTTLRELERRNRKPRR